MKHSYRFDHVPGPEWLYTDDWRLVLDCGTSGILGVGPCRLQLAEIADWMRAEIAFRLRLLEGAVTTYLSQNERGGYTVTVSAEELRLSFVGPLDDVRGSWIAPITVEQEKPISVAIRSAEDAVDIWLDGALVLSVPDLESGPAGSFGFLIEVGSRVIIESFEAETDTVALLDIKAHEAVALRGTVQPFVGGGDAQRIFDEAEAAFTEGLSVVTENMEEDINDHMDRAALLYRQALISGIHEVFLPRALERGDIDEVSAERLRADLERLSDDELSHAEFVRIGRGLPADIFSSTAYPDLAVRLYSVPFSNIGGISPWPPLTDRPTVLSIAVENRGLEKVDKSFDINLLVDGALAKTWTFSPIIADEDPAHNANPFEPGEVRIYDHEVSFSQPGTHTFKWVVDPANKISESDKTNNTLTVSATWQHPPDLVVDDIEPVGAAAGGQKTKWKIRVKNIGTGDVTYPFEVAFHPGVPGGSHESFWIKSLAAGATATVTSTQSFRVSGKAKLRAIVDPGNLVTEKRPKGETNNELVKEFDLQPVELAIKTGSLSVSPKQPLPYEPVTISFVVENKGKGDAQHPFWIRVMPGKLTSKALLVPVLIKAGPLKAGGSAALSHQLTLPPGTHSIGIEADFPNPDAVYFEQDRNDNVAIQQIFVPEPNVKIASAKPSKSCLNTYSVALHRTGSYWKGDVLLRAVHKGKVLATGDIKSKSAFGSLSIRNLDPDTTDEGKYNWKADVTIEAIAKWQTRTFPKSADTSIVPMRQYARPYLRSMSPQNGQPGQTTQVTFQGATLLRPDKSVDINVFPAAGGGEDKSIGVSVVETKVIDGATDKIVVNLSIAPGAAKGKRDITIANCANWFWTAPFWVGDIPQPPKKEPPKKTPVVKKPDLAMLALYTKPAWTDPGGLAPNQSFVAHFSGQNMGTADAPASKLLIILNSGMSGQKSKKLTVPKLKPSEFFSGSWSFPSGLPKGDYFLDVYLDIEKKVSEFSETNNMASLGFKVSD